ncbi:MAG: sugar ABC transporter substrate-binding protein [Bifidobacteriaceae bacterium]|jgi:ribose transport system substrate-binding protein|nr:sugar ABC transporter substrate-binding protein [Bifidobacteriaceae bacterium]
MRRKTTIAIALCAVLAASLAACTQEGDDKPSPKADGSKDVTVCMASFTLGGPYFVGMEQTVTKNGKEAGAKVIASNADGDAAKLQSNIEDCVTQQVDGIIISGGPLNDFPEGLQAAEEANIPVVLVDRLFSSPNFASWVGPDNEQLGKQDGEYLVANLPEGGRVIVIKGGEADNTIGIARTQGVTDALTAAGKFEVTVAPDFGGWSSDGGQTAMENMLSQHADIVAVFCENDAMCLGAQTAAEDAGRSAEMIFAGVDGQNEAIQAILANGNYKITGYNDATVIGALGIEALLKVIDGKTVDKEQKIDSPAITIDNAEEYKDAGIY